jgi:hypothetical protein
MGLRDGAGLRLVALLLMALVCADLALGAACEAVRLPGAGEAPIVADAGAERSADACAGVCVPDCFCCLRSETAVATTTVPPLVLVSEAPDQGPDSVTAVVRPVPELPPLLIS